MATEKIWTPYVECVIIFLFVRFGLQKKKPAVFRFSYSHTHKLKYEFENSYLNWHLFTRYQNLFEAQMYLCYQMNCIHSLLGNQTLVYLWDPTVIIFFYSKYMKIGSLIGKTTEDDTTNK